MQGSVEQQLQRKVAFVQELKTLPIAIQTAAANEQHYEVGRWPPAHPPPPDSNALMLGIGYIELPGGNICAGSPVRGCMATAWHPCAAVLQQAKLMLSPHL
jgi:hypothetical protein